MDNYSAHESGDVIEMLNRGCTEVAFLPPNMTGKLQLMDVGYNAPFKARLNTLRETWLKEAPGNVSFKVTRKQISKWVEEAWYAIPNETAMNTLVSMGYIDRV
jgi:hypothetical protein